ncbi:MAG TPA: SPOR domain-containing protein [Gemmatimonadales bacterium]|jgi:cell division septation protein DedD|nr:SPOR domain-containing protein [Gemmatimonadales bacterium]
MRLGFSVSGVLLAFGLSSVPLGGLAAQTDPRLVTAVRLAQDGMSDSARAVVGRLLFAMQPDDSLYPEVLYTTGLLAKTEHDRRLALRRVVVDYGQSSWADDALLQLAQLDYAGGNAAAAIRQIELLLRDYPGTPLFATAAFWGARAAGDRHDAATACRMAELGLSAAGNDIELKNQLEFQKQRCQGLAALAAESTRLAVADSISKAKADSVARAHSRRSGARATERLPVKPSERPTGRSGFYVQVSAVATQAAASAEIARVKRAGYTAVAMKEAGYLKIRAGAFRTRPEAETALAQIKARLGGHPFLVRVP